MLKGFADQAGKMKAGPEIRSLIQFFRMNLNEPSYPLVGKFDLIFCRNVLIYFDMRGREQVVRRLARFLSPGGYLFLGDAESLHGASDCLRTVIPLSIPEKKIHRDAKSSALQSKSWSLTIPR